MHGKVFIDEWGEIIVAFPANETLKAAIRTIPTAHYDFYERRGWQIWPSERTIPAVLALARQFNLVIDPTLHGSPADLVAHFNSARYAASQASRPATLFKVPLPGLTASQHAGIKYTVRAMRCWIADEDERDRKAIALGTLQAANAFPAIIVCPANYNNAWKRTLENYLPDKKLLGARSDSTKQPTDLVLINYEALDGTDIALQALNRRPYGLILDEAHYVKNSDAQRTRRVLALSQGIHYRLLLTATPILNGPYELISQLRVMGRLGEFGGYEHFFQHYCLGQENGAACLDELGRLLRMRCLLRRLELNPTTPHRHYLRAGIDNREEYNAKEITASKNDNWPGWHTAPRLELAWGKFDTTIAWIRKFLETTDEKLVVFAYHREIVGEIACTFQAPWITSETTKSQRAAAIAKFTDDPECQLIVLGIRVDSRGWRLKPARQALFVELGFTPADQERAEGLLAQPALTHYMIATNTIEENFFDRIGDKQYVIRTIMDPLLAK